MLLLFITVIVISLPQCKKDWLDEKPDKKLVVPSTLTDLQALLNNESVFTISATPAMGEMSCDDYYLMDNIYTNAKDIEKKIYTWAPGDIYSGSVNIADWNAPYQIIYYTNIILETLETIERNEANKISWDNIKGQALFHRAYANFHLAQIFCKPFNEATANTDPGLILRTKSDVNAPSVRSTVEQSYNQIFEDLNLSKRLLLTTPPAYPLTPYKASALALLARTYLLIEKYDSALYYADATLQINNVLVNYSSTYNPSNNNPITVYSPEILYFSMMYMYNIMPYNNGLGNVDTVLYKLYDNNDARKTIFFKTISGRLAFCGTYSGLPFYFFNGIATDEVYLIRAECYARSNKVDLALQDLNALQKKRWKDNAVFTPTTAANADEALSKILIERRKELCFRGIRWMDLRRLNKQAQTAKTLTRIINGQIITLPPNDIKYVFPIPNNEILYSGIEQNPR